MAGIKESELVNELPMPMIQFVQKNLNKHFLFVRKKVDERIFGYQSSPI